MKNRNPLANDSVGKGFLVLSSIIEERCHWVSEIPKYFKNVVDLYDVISDMQIMDKKEKTSMVIKELNEKT